MGNGLKNKQSYKNATAGLMFAFVIVLIYYFAVAFGGTSRNTYYATFLNVDGVNVGANVYLSGVLVGRLSKVKLNKDIVNVAVQIDSGVKIPSDSQLQITTQGYLGTKALTIYPGFEGQFLKNEDQFISVQNSVDFIGLLNAYIKNKVSEKEKQAKNEQK